MNARKGVPLIANCPTGPEVEAVETSACHAEESRCNSGRVRTDLPADLPTQTSRLSLVVHQLRRLALNQEKDGQHVPRELISHRKAVDGSHFMEAAMVPLFLDGLSTLCQYSTTAFSGFCAAVRWHIRQMLASPA